MFRYRHVYSEAIRAVATGKVNLKDLATHVFDFEDIQNAMDQSIHNKNDVVKGVVRILKM